ncbi:carbonic anhydrase [Nostoc sp. TCL26-01]|uniref:carbonic anhydrase n=1 Tax=Nostoc sp. TCL26-01 TaxID=2576904 RepID=UPI0015B937A2|nr:carbonic anhydrase [Nostoc sp. TCL26-01]QLE58621.1 carbonic anhydrase [Nostoc sp. TCL26-01]
MSKINGFIGRRNFLWLAGTAGLAIATTAVSGSLISSADDKPSNLNPVNPQQALKLLLDGNQRFINKQPKHPHQSSVHLELVAKTQYPFAAILGCADSRVPAEIIFDQGLGDLFSVRVAGNIASDIAIGSLEYATSVLGTQLIVVLGHRRCGAVAAAMKDELLPGKISSIVENIKPALSNIKSTKDIEEAAVIANIQYQAAILQEKSPILAQLIDQGKLKIVEACYDIDTGKVSIIAYSNAI